MGVLEIAVLKKSGSPAPFRPNCSRDSREKVTTGENRSDSDADFTIEDFVVAVIQGRNVDLMEQTYVLEDQVRIQVELGNYKNY